MKAKAMDGSRLSEARVGVFVLGALAILVFGSLWIAGSSYLGASRTTYRVLMRDAGGLQAGDRIRFAGVPVGKVEEVKLRPGDDWPVELVVFVRSTVALRAEDTANVATAGLMGTPFLELRRGSATAALLEEGGTIRGAPPTGLSRTMERVDEVAVRTTELLETTTALLERGSDELFDLTDRMQRLLSDENVRDAGTVLATLGRTVREAEPRLSTILDGLEDIASNLDDGTREIPVVAEEVSALVDDLRSAIGPGGERLETLLGEVRDSFGSVQSIVDANEHEIGAAIHDLRETAANLEAFSRRIREHPLSLLRGGGQADRKPGQGVPRETNR